MSGKRTPTSSFHLILEVDETMGDFLCKISTEMARKYKSNFIIDNKEYRPHITLYLFSAPVRNIGKIISEVDKLSRDIKSLEVEVDGMILSDSGWIMIDVDSSKRQLLGYHKKAVWLINPLREGVLRQKYRNRVYFESLKPNEKTSLLKYGDKHAFKDFHSHLSVAQIDDLAVAKKAFGEFKSVKLPKYLTVSSIQLIRTIGNESGGVGKILFDKKL